MTPQLTMWILAAINITLNIAMIVLIIVAIIKFGKMIKENAVRQQQFVDVYWRMDKAAVANAQGLDDRIIERTADLNNRLAYLTRWQKITAKMVRDQHNQQSRSEK